MGTTPVAAILDERTKVPIYAVWTVGVMLCFITGYVVRLDSANGYQDSRLDKQREAIIRGQEMDLKIVEHQNASDKILAEVVGELKYLRETRKK